jgi:uncharacterized protein YbjT (DUF2867 family)
MSARLHALELTTKMMSARAALLLGATGLVGGQCLELLLHDDSYGRVVTLGRRLLPVKHEKLEQHAIDFERAGDFAELIRAQDVFCCLGTTIKKAGSREAFRKVDFDYPVRLAELALARGAEQFLLVSALGASPRSSVFYNRVKGETEAAIAGLSFKGVQIFRPSLLLGEREEFRPGERVAEKASWLFSFLLVGSLGKYKPVQARAVAAAMLQVATENPAGVNIFESDRIRRMTEQEQFLKDER